uniref:Uncharacterized protein n=1 Tax=Glossina austeni TaxID=7395 RepID=A0A1A9UR49_GLOAU
MEEEEEETDKTDQKPTVAKVGAVRIGLKWHISLLRLSVLLVCSRSLGKRCIMVGGTAYNLRNVADGHLCAVANKVAAELLAEVDADVLITFEVFNEAIFEILVAVVVVANFVVIASVIVLRSIILETAVAVIRALCTVALSMTSEEELSMLLAAATVGVVVIVVGMFSLTLEFVMKTFLRVLKLLYTTLQFIEFSKRC